MDGFTFDDLKAVVEYSSVCFGIFHRATRVITTPNQALRQRLEGDSFSVSIVADEEGRLYGRLDKDGTPVSLRVLTGNDASGGCLVEVYLANAKSSNDNAPTSDLIQLVDMTSDGVWEWFPSLQYEFMSERFWSILGYDHREMPSSPDAWMGIIDPGDLTVATKMYNDHVATKGVAEYNCNVIYTHKKGHEVQVKCRGAVVEWLPDGSPWRLLGTHTDISEIAQAVDAKARFVSRMSHEIRSPICAILNECEMLEENSATSVIADACDQLLALCNDILTINKLRKPMAMAVLRRSVSVGEFFRKAVRRHAGQAQKHELSLESNVVAVPPVSLMMDVSKCNQVIDNLVSNAFKYTEKGGHVVMGLNCRPISFKPHSQTGYPNNISAEAVMQKWTEQENEWEVELTVTDTGKGIHNDDKEFVFAKFSQANSSMQGAGLGLSISKELAQLMQGDVYLRVTEVGKGSTFAFVVPATVARPPPEAPARSDSGADAVDPEKPAKTPQAKVSTIRILSADDMLTNRKIMRRRIRALEEQLGNVTVEVIDAVNGREAVKTFEDGGKFDLVFMDCLMPEMDGFEAAKEIHRLCDERSIHRVPVVAVTASVSTGLHKECREAGIAHIVTKPFGTMDLMPILHSAIELQQGGTLGSPITSVTRSATPKVSPSASVSTKQASAGDSPPTGEPCPQENSRGQAPAEQSASGPVLAEPILAEPVLAERKPQKPAPIQLGASPPQRGAVSPSPCPRTPKTWHSRSGVDVLKYDSFETGRRGSPRATFRERDGRDAEVGTE